MEGVIKEVRRNLHEISEEWEKMKHTVHKKNTRIEATAVSIKQLEHLQREVSSLKHSLPKLVQDVRQSLVLAKENRTDLKMAQNDLEESYRNLSHTTARLQALKSECEAERKAKLTAMRDFDEVSEQLCLQSEYSASMGAVSCTLLWRASQQEQVVPALLAGSQMKSFLSVICHTVSSFLATYENEELPSEITEEIQFVLALVGVVTNVAASAIGREFLAGCDQCGPVLDTFSSLLAQPPSKQTARLKNLALMCLYNLSINQKGLKVVAQIKGLVPILTWLLGAEDSEDIKMHTLLLLHSLILEPGNLNLLLEAKEGLPAEVMETLCKSSNQDMREVASEIRDGINLLDTEQ